MSRPITPSANRLLHALLHKHGCMAHKAELVYGFTEGRTEHSSEMYEQEAQQLIGWLRSHFNDPAAPPQRDAADRMRKKVMAICHTMGWYQRDAEGNLVLRNGQPVLDWQRIDAFCTQRTQPKKPLRELTASELPSVITSFERLLKSDLK
ncbi:MAG: hypothetical protein RML37_12015 [Chitinophagales bacterium]|nr:hypothetical protein [Chitinophagales bacterium]